MNDADRSGAPGAYDPNLDSENFSSGPGQDTSGVNNVVNAPNFAGGQPLGFLGTPNGSILEFVGSGTGTSGTVIPLAGPACNDGSSTIP